MKTRYFAYGSNMNTARLLGRVPSARAMGWAQLVDYVLTINKVGRDGSGKANIARRSGASVIGVLFEMEEADLRKLDRIEAGYRREQVALTTQDRTQSTAWTYISTQTAKGLKPSQLYMDYIVSGAIENMLPADYINLLLSLSSKAET